MFVDSTFSLAGLLGFAAALFVSVLLVLTKHLHGAHTLDSDEGVQKFHTAPTPRIGGVSLIVGYFVGWIFMEGGAKDLFG